MRRIRYIKTFLVIGAVLMIGLCALLLIGQLDRSVPSSGAKLIMNNASEAKHGTV